MTEILRLPDWRARLGAYLAETERMPFRPGVHDCALFAARARLAQSGDAALEARIAAWAGRYTSLQEGLELALKEGRTGFDLVIEGLAEIPRSYAGVGDIVELPGLDGLAAFGVVIGELVATTGLRGRELVRLTAARKAWRV